MKVKKPIKFLCGTCKDKLECLGKPEPYCPRLEPIDLWDRILQVIMWALILRAC